MFLQTADGSKVDICTEHGISCLHLMVISWLPRKGVEGKDIYIYIFYGEQGCPTACCSSSHTSGYFHPFCRDKCGCFLRRPVDTSSRFCGNQNRGNRAIFIRDSGDRDRYHKTKPKQSSSAESWQERNRNKHTHCKIRKSSVLTHLWFCRNTPG